MRKLPPLTALRAFEAAARLASFKRAAQELSLSPTAISHQVRQLEDRLGLALFERQPRQVVLTEAGRRLYPVLRDGFDAAAATIEALRSAPPRPLLTISTTRAFAARWLVPRLGDFTAADVNAVEQRVGEQRSHLVGERAALVGGELAQVDVVDLAQAQQEGGG